MQDGPYSINNVVILKQGLTNDPSADFSAHLPIIDKIIEILNEYSISYSRIDDFRLQLHYGQNVATRSRKEEDYIIEVRQHHSLQ